MANQPSPPTAQPPPDLPSMPDVSDTLTNYLRTFSLWCRHGFAAMLKANTALPGILLQASDAPAGTTPKVFMLQVSTAGTLVVTPMALGVGEASMLRTAGNVSLGKPILIGGPTHDVRVRTVDETLNSAVPSGGVLRFDAIDFDTDGFAPTNSPFDQITIPAGLGGVYVLTAWSSGSGNQSTSLGMGVRLNGAQRYSSTNQTIYGPGSVNYVLDCGAVEILHLDDGDTLQMVNNSGTNVVAGAEPFAGPSVFKSVTLALARMT